MKFASLHTHSSAGSLLDALDPPDRLLERARDLRYGALAITDHGLMTGLIPATLAARRLGMKYIPAIEAYYTPFGHQVRPQKGESHDDHVLHLTLLVQNEQGYRNLCWLSSEGWLSGFYRKPRIDANLLRQCHDGLVCLSGCLSGPLAHFLLKGETARAHQQCEQFIKIFGKDRFFIELMPEEFADQARINPLLAQMAKQYGLEMVLTLDAHYACREDAGPHDILLCVGTAANYNDPKRMRFPSETFYLKSLKEIKQLGMHRSYPGCVENTWTISQTCNYELPLAAHGAPILFPRYPVPEGQTPLQHLRGLALEGLEVLKGRERSGAAQDGLYGSLEAYRERIKRELKVIHQNGFVEYFLLVQDLVRHAKRKGFPVAPGRGSSAGSIVAYCTGITEVDPIRWGLPFERFLGSEDEKRTTLPDIDLDFGPSARPKVIHYLKNRYGEGNVMPICTFAQEGARSVVRDVGRVLRIPLGEVNTLTAAIPQSGRMKVDLNHALEIVPGLAERFEQYDPLLPIARRLEGTTRHAGQHAGGIIITPEDVRHYLPVFLARPDADGGKQKEKQVVVQADLESVEQVAVKLDILSVSMLDVIWQTCRSIRRQDQIDIHPYRIPLDDRKTYDLFCSGRTEGVFQFAGQQMKELLKGLKPRNVEDLSLANALIRPGAERGAEKVIAVRNGEARPTYIIPALKPILKKTEGEFVFQEQGIAAVMLIAGASFNEADRFRKATGKKDMALMMKQKELLISGGLANGHDIEHLESLWNVLVAYATYSFAGAHSISYSIQGMWSAYLKAHHPDHFFAALLTNYAGKKEKFARLLQEARSCGIKILPPDINRSRVAFRRERPGEIRFGFCGIDKLGEAGLGVLKMMKKQLDELALTGRYWTQAPRG